jgi:hypothetical protein
VDWGEAGAHGIYPPETVGGLKEQDKGEQQLADADGNYFFGFVTEYEWWAGLSIEDPRHIARLANVDVSQALADTSTLLVNSLVPILNGMPPREGCKRVAYTRREICSALHLQVLSKLSAGLTIQEYLGEFVPHFQGIPIVACDGISAAESVIS